jgi:soluble lytic murein transglycosylase
MQRASVGPPQLLYEEAQEADPATAQALYCRLSEGFPEISEYLLLASALAAMPDVEAVRELKNIIDYRPHSPAAFEAHLILARYYADLGEEEAEVQYRAALELEGSIALRLELARYLEGRGKVEEAYQEYKGLLSDHPVAFEDMRRLATDPLVLAADLNAALYFSDALESLRLVVEPNSLRARALEGLGRYEEARSEYEAWLEGNPEDGEARLGLARTLARLGYVEEALVEYRKVEGAESLLAQAELLEALDPEKALEIYQDLPYPYGWWRGATLLEGEGRLAEALPLYSRLAGSDTALADDAAYRLYLLAQRLADPEALDEASALLKDLEPDYFALLAQKRGFSAAVAPLPPDGEAILEKVKALELLGLDRFALRELLFAARLGESPAMELAMAQALSERGFLRDAQGIAVKAIQSLHAAPLSLWRLAYPKPYFQEVEEAAQEFGLDPSLVYAVMREESRYDPEAISRAYAQGLMQIIPSTRDWIAEQLKIEIDPTEIFDPSMNTHLGAWYLRHLLDYFQGDIEYALAAYNGGPGNVNAWKENPLIQEKADFLRWIGFGETREYVPKVLLSYEVYKWLEQAEGE